MELFGGIFGVYFLVRPQGDRLRFPSCGTVARVKTLMLFDLTPPNNQFFSQAMNIKCWKYSCNLMANAILLLATLFLQITNGVEILVIQ